ncbi:hypothetical protein EBN03_25985 [Nocardia stercoris]|uniref:Uncharacterized protein n=1 Tax=Nocardia stercoris TaxID=2483361 RepID=A0A3M2KV64_9NOCA|nr:hypothetical protein EBN03_25985 [Nocardia stercoris]
MVQDLVRAAERLAAGLGDGGNVLAARARALAEETGGHARRLLLEDRLAAEERFAPASSGVHPEPFAPGFTAEHLEDGLPDTRNTFLYEDYKRMYEQRLGRSLTAAEDGTLREGCIGMTRLRLNNPVAVPMHVAIGDPAAHGLAAETEHLLAKGEAAAKAAVHYYDGYIRTRQQIYQLRRAMADGRGGRDVLGRIRALEQTSDRWEAALNTSRAEGARAWAKVGEHQAEAQRLRSMAKIVEGRRGFELASGYAERYDAILRSGPRDALELQQRIKGDPVLSRLRNAHMPIQPEVPPSKLETVIYAKHFWTGQELTVDAAGVQTPTSWIEPRPLRFAPDPATGQVDMSHDYYQGKIGYTNFDYGWYDRGSNTWWNANHRVIPEDPSRPMLVYQNTPDTFFRSHHDFDAQVFGLALVEKVI